MFGRVAACGIAVFILMMPAVSNGDTIVLVGSGVPTVVDVIATPAPSAGPAEHQIQNAASQQAAAPTQVAMLDAANAGAGRMDIAALDPTAPAVPAPTATAPAIQSPLAEPFGLNVAPVDSGNVLTKWSGVEAALRAEDDVFSRCRAQPELCPVAAQNFLAIVEQGRALSGRARIGVINRAVNMAIIPTTDFAQWGVADRWSAPLETFTTGRGDCEDYAIAKYVALREAGVAGDDVKLVIVRNLAANEDHAVVATRVDGEWVILDNRWLMMVKDSNVSEEIPLFVLDQTGVFAFTAKAMPVASRAAPASIVIN
jgi:predicted transglutaminase-like cysteine proteinase